MPSKDILIEKLLEGDEDFKNLYFEHRKLDDRISGLENKDNLSMDEELEVKKLKKIKLSLKDRMQIRINIYKKDN